MGVFSFLFGKTIKINDEFFGEMVFSEFKKNLEKNYFECKKQFNPINDIIELSIDGKMSGPTQTQKDFFKKIESNYDEIISSIKPLIEDKFQNWKDDFKILDFKVSKSVFKTNFSASNSLSVTYLYSAIILPQFL